ncbi:pre-mRNA-splicing factor SYF2 [Dimargaris verticillata]|uniref:Pre-mRNA-splicing factor SYF2 n=1 Tax=Dimargaris verticillata TaxID=2761393 RepID=A0A9W8B951_9FUNG|nr:pre-mRNA-splicing factor SYF2 [Dimargaris verticillata]
MAPSSPQSPLPAGTPTDIDPIEADSNHASPAIANDGSNSPLIDPVESIPQTQQPATTMHDRAAKLEELRARMTQSSRDSRMDVYSEFQRQKSDPRAEARQDRARREAEILQARQEAMDQGVDYERRRFWGYSVEAVEKWNAKQEAKKSREEQAKFAGHAQWAIKKYHKAVNQLKPDLRAYETQRAQATTHTLQASTSSQALVAYDGDTLALDLTAAQSKPSREAVDRLAHHVSKDLEKRTQIKKHKRDDGDITYINEKNKKFNRRITQAYESYTKEIRDSFERGTAL